MRTFYFYDRANRLQTTVAGTRVTTYTQDAAGNCTRVTAPDSSTTYHWDTAGRMASADVDAGTVTFTYDADGRRTAKQGTDGSAIGFLYDHKKLIAETDEVGGDVAALYATTADAEYGDLIGEDGGYCHNYDAQNDTASLTDTAGAVQAAYKYYAFGHVSAYAVEGDGWQSVTSDQWATGDTALWSDLPAELNSRMLAGGRKQYYLDTDTHLHLLGTGNNGRYYDAALGRFTSEDPIRQSAGDLNLYRYVDNSPIDQLDPSGHDAQADEEKRREEEERKKREEAERKAAAAAKQEDGKKQEQKEQQRQDKPLSANEQRLKGLTDQRAKYEDAKNKAHANGDTKAEEQLWSRIQLNDKQERLADLEVRKDYDAAHGGQFQDSLWKDVQAAHKVLADTIADAGKISKEDYDKAYWSGAREGAQGGLSIASSTLSHGLTDKVGLTDSDKYQGEGYSGARKAATAGSILLETAATLGVGAVAQGGIRGTSLVARGINAAAESKNLVQAAKVFDTASTVYGAGQSVIQAGEGAAAIANNPKDWHGYAQAAAGAATSFLGIKGIAGGLNNAAKAANKLEGTLASEAESGAKGLASLEANAAKSESKATAAVSKSETAPATTAEVAPAKSPAVEATKPTTPAPAQPAAGLPVSPAKASATAEVSVGSSPAPIPGRASTSPVREGETVTYKESARRAVPRDDLTGDHIPSSAAVRKNVEGTLGRDLTADEAKALHNNTNTVVVRSDLHADGRTFKGKNTASRISEDAKDLRKASDLDKAEHIANAAKNGVDAAELRKSFKSLDKMNDALFKRLSTKQGIRDFFREYGG